MELNPINNTTLTEFTCFSALPEETREHVILDMLNAKTAELSNNRDFAIRFMRGIGNSEIRSVINSRIKWNSVITLPASTKHSYAQAYQQPNQETIDFYVGYVKSFENLNQDIVVKTEGYAAENNGFLIKLGERKCRVNSLIIKDGGGARTCPQRNINAAGLATLPNLQGLRRLEIVSCRYVTDDALKPLILMPELQYLKLSDNMIVCRPEALNGEFLKELCKSNTLEEIDLSNQSGLSPKVLDYLSRAKEQLKALNLDFAVAGAKASDWKALVDNLSVKCRVQRLSIMCAKLSDEVLDVMASWSQLQSLDISYAKGVTQAGIEAFKNKRPDVKFVFNNGVEEDS